MGTDPASLRSAGPNRKKVKAHTNKSALVNPSSTVAQYIVGNSGDTTMPAFSGLWDGVHGDGYAAMPKADALPPAQRGIVRTLMQGRGMHGHVTALGRNAPASIARVVADRADVVAVGGMEAWPSRDPDAANRVTITNLGDELQGGAGTALDVIARPSNATESDMAHTYDTTLRNGHPADAADNGATSPAVTEAISDGT